MKVTGALVALLFGACSASGSPPKAHELTLSYTFDEYAAHFGKKYADDAEKSARRLIFKARLSEILKHNAAGHSWRKGVNQFTDRTDEERKSVNGYKIAMRSGFESSAEIYSSKEFKYDDNLNVDWREKGVVTPVKDQGQCGSCWSFATAETVESHAALAGHPLEVLSEQQVLSCPFGTNPKHCGGTGGCSGGTAEVGFESIVKAGGMTSEWYYPYVSYFGNNEACSDKLAKMDKTFKVTGNNKLPTNSYEAIMSAIQNVGPLAISVDASWHDYESGVFDSCNQTSPVIDHAVQLVGVGQDKEHGPYWLVRNSWSPNWGESGFIRLRRIVDQSKQRCAYDTNPAVGSGCDGGPSKEYVCGTCGILFDVAYPIVEKP